MAWCSARAAAQLRRVPALDADVTHSSSERLQGQGEYLQRRRLEPPRRSGAALCRPAASPLVSSLRRGASLRGGHSNLPRRARGRAAASNMDLLDEISKATTDFLTAGCPWPSGVPPTRVSASATPTATSKSTPRWACRNCRACASRRGCAAAARDSGGPRRPRAGHVRQHRLHRPRVRRPHAARRLAHDVLQRKATAAAGPDGFLSADKRSRGRRARAAASVTKRAPSSTASRASYGPFGLFANTADALDAKNASASVGASSTSHAARCASPARCRPSCAAPRRSRPRCPPARFRRA